MRKKAKKPQAKRKIKDLPASKGKGKAVKGGFLLSNAVKITAVSPLSLSSIPPNPI